MRRIPVVILGIGGVGRQLIQHIVDTRRLHAKQGLHIGVVGICDSRSLLLVNDAMVSGMSDECLLEICKLKASAAFLPMLSSKFGNFEVFGAAEIPGKLMATAGDLGRITGLAFVDCSASSETVGLLNQVIELGCCVVLANKKPLTSDMEVYDKLVSHPRRIRYESTDLLWENNVFIVPNCMTFSSSIPHQHRATSISFLPRSSSSIRLICLYSAMTASQPVNLPTSLPIEDSVFSALPSGGGRCSPHIGRCFPHAGRYLFVSALSVLSEFEFLPRCRSSRIIALRDCCSLRTAGIIPSISQRCRSTAYRRWSNASIDSFTRFWRASMAVKVSRQVIRSPFSGFDTIVSPTR